MEKLTYEEMLGELQALLGEPVAVVLLVKIAHVERPIAFFRGKLARGAPRDLYRDWGLHRSVGGESIVFVIGDDPLPSFFLLRKGDYKFGHRDDDGALSYTMGKVRVLVGEPEARPRRTARPEE